MFSLFLLVFDYEYFNVEFTFKQKNLVFMPVDSYRKNQWNLFGYGYRHESHIFLNCEDKTSKFSMLKNSEFGKRLLVISQLKL